MSSERAPLPPSPVPAAPPSAGELTQLHDDELLRLLAALQGDGRSLDAPLEVLRNRWTRPARHVISRVLASYELSGDDTEDLLQEAFARLLERGLGQFRGASAHALTPPGPKAPHANASNERASHGQSARAFFLRIAKHQTIDHCRRRKVQRTATGSGPVDERGDTEHRSVQDEAVAVAREEEHRREGGELYWQAMRRLEREHPNEAAAWRLYHHEGMEDHQACADQLGISLANSYKRVSRAQAYLRAYVLELAAEEEER